jgi:hypothetical protein
MPRKLADADLRTIAEVVAEMAKHRGATFDTGAQAFAFARAMQADPNFKAQLANVARRIVARRETTMPRHLLAPLAPLYRELEEALKRIESARR